ncbi:MAG: DMT family transporter [Actinobacteria bacterium]|nr:DMT family transporter [Actinomycetota bacterium]
MVSIVFGLLTACFFASSGLLSSRAVKIIGSASSVAWVMLLGLIITTPFVVAAGVPANIGPSIPWMVVLGLGNVIGILVAGFALRVGKVGVVAPILATEGAIAAVIAALLGESIAPVVGFMLLVIVGGIVISAIAPDPAPLVNERPLYAVVLSTLAAACFGVSLFAAGNLSNDVPIPWVLLPARLAGVLIILIPLLVVRKLQITRSTVPLIVAMAFTEILGFVCFSIGAQYQVAITSVLSSQFAPIAAVAAYFLFKEKLGRLQIAGVVVLVMGVTSLTVAASAPG